MVARIVVFLIGLRSKILHVKILHRFQVLAPDGQVFYIHVFLLSKKTKNPLRRQAIHKKEKALR